MLVLTVQINVCTTEYFSVAINFCILYFDTRGTVKEKKTLDHFLQKAICMRLFCCSENAGSFGHHQMYPF